MARISADPIIVRPTANIFTALTGVALLATLLALIVVLVQSQALYGSYIL